MNNPKQVSHLDDHRNKYQASRIDDISEIDRHVRSESLIHDSAITLLMSRSIHRALHLADPNLIHSIQQHPNI